jgi:hypothetical protein
MINLFNVHTAGCFGTSSIIVVELVVDLDDWLQECDTYKRSCDLRVNGTCSSNDDIRFQAVCLISSWMMEVN